MDEHDWLAERFEEHRTHLRAVMGFTVSRGKIVEIDALSDPARLRQLDLSVLDE